MSLRRHGLFCAFIAFVGCGDDTGTDDEATHTTTDASSSGTGASTTDADTTESGTIFADSTTADLEVACGEGLTCSGGDVCVEDAFDPECTDLEDPKGMCPEGQEMTFCGGAGQPCCCLPPPASEWRCVTPTDCDGPASCDCLVELCTDGRACTSLGADPEHLFRCESPPKP